MREEVYDISGMHCAACSASVEKVTRRLPGVERSDVNLVAERMTIVYDETQVTPEQIIAKVEKAGFGAKLHQEKQEAAPVQTGEDPEELELRRKKRELIVSAIFSCALLYVSMGQMLPFGLPPLPLPVQNTVRSLHARWAAEEAAMRRSQPGFDLKAELKNPEMRRLMQLPGMRVQDAYRLAHYEDALRTTAQTVEQGVVERVQQRAARPLENGLRPGAAASVRPDVAAMTRAQREALERRVLHGAQIEL